MERNDLLKRLTRAREQKRKYQIIHLGKGSWIVRKLKPGGAIERTYGVNTRLLKCSCPDHKEISKDTNGVYPTVCKHIVLCLFEGVRMVAEAEVKKRGGERWAA